MKNHIHNQCTALVQAVLKKSKKPLAMREIVQLVLASQQAKHESRLASRRDIYNAVHNNTNKESSLFEVVGQAFRGQNGDSNQMAYRLRKDGK